MSDTKAGNQADGENAPATLLTIREFSRQSRLSVTQIRRLVKAGRIPFLQPGGRGGKLLFSQDALSAAAGALAAPASSPPAPKVRPKAGGDPAGWKIEPRIHPFGDIDARTQET